MQEGPWPPVKGDRDSGLHLELEYVMGLHNYRAAAANELQLGTFDRDLWHWALSMEDGHISAAHAIYVRLRAEVLAQGSLDSDRLNGCSYRD
ncbi:hypothetical protein D0544_04395 [Aestuariirhabdus litorea]|uniref:Uncharacterized protein n=1 Tax=Aestuariirhabdus litorea TaxID=2528527 RepID=A0A3P3VUB4_9GAMM|nr:hypothetical protein D0544_04395 [Aestuariirhabdus litorea]